MIPSFKFVIRKTKKSSLLFENHHSIMKQHGGMIKIRAIISRNYHVFECFARLIIIDEIIL